MISTAGFMFLTIWTESCEERTWTAKTNCRWNIDSERFILSGFCLHMSFMMMPSAPLFSIYNSFILQYVVRPRPVAALCYVSTIDFPMRSIYLFPYSEPISLSVLTLLSSRQFQTALSKIPSLFVFDTQLAGCNQPLYISTIPLKIFTPRSLWLRSMSWNSDQLSKPEFTMLSS